MGDLCSDAEDFEFVDSDLDDDVDVNVDDDVGMDILDDREVELDAGREAGWETKTFANFNVEAWSSADVGLGNFLFKRFFTFIGRTAVALRDGTTGGNSDPTWLNESRDSLALEAELLTRAVDFCGRPRDRLRGGGTKVKELEVEDSDSDPAEFARLE